MAYGATKSFEYAKTKRITSLPCTNKGKISRINEHFTFVHNLKNSISQHIYNNRFDLLSSESKNNLKKDYYDKNFK